MPYRMARPKAVRESQTALVVPSHEAKAVGRGGIASTSPEALCPTTEVRAFSPRQIGLGLACLADGHAVRAGEVEAGVLPTPEVTGGDGPKIACRKTTRVVLVLVL